MIKPLRFILEVLRNNILIDNTIIPVVKRPYPLDKTPCITLDDSGGSSILSKDLINQQLPLPATHPQYNPLDPQKLFAQEVIQTKYNTTININVWCDTENEREQINNQIIRLFNLAFSDYYKYCANYDNGECLTLDNPCETINNVGAYGVKGQCPHKKENEYKNIFSKYDLDKYSFVLDEPFSLDDLSTRPKTCRSIFKLRISYYTNHIVGGTITTDLEWSEE